MQRIKPEVMYRDRDLGSSLYRGTRPIEAHPWHAEHLPRANRLHCPLPRDFPSAKLDTIAVYVVPSWGGSGRRSDLRVREAGVLLLRNETSNLVFRWYREAEQGDPTLLRTWALRRRVQVVSAQAHARRPIRKRMIRRAAFCTPSTLLRSRRCCHVRAGGTVDTKRLKPRPFRLQRAFFGSVRLRLGATARPHCVKG
jgi:hypothetical protein